VQPAHLGKGNNPSSIHDSPRFRSVLGQKQGVSGIGDPIGGVATATDRYNSLAMLVCRRGETLAQLLTRLDQAIDKGLARRRLH